MLEPKETKLDNEDSYILEYWCKLCNRHEQATRGSEADNCVYKTDFTARAENFAVDSECIKDPTLARRRDIECPHCKYNEAVSFT